MKCTSDSEVFVEAERLDLVFHFDAGEDRSMRGQFVSLAKDPMGYIMRRRDFLHALKDVSFTARRGDRIAIVGKNGAGKTTLCRCLAGCYHPKGRLSIRGDVRFILDPSVMVYPELSGRENARIMVEILYPELSPALRREAVAEALEFSGLDRFLDTPYRLYSNGMQTRLCLSVSTCRPADVFILDEVFEAADREFQERLSRRMLDLLSKAGVVFFVSHSEDQIRRVCNKALLLHHGELRDAGSVDGVLKSYARLIQG